VRPYSALIGYPVDHSPSPLLYGSFAQSCNFRPYEHRRIPLKEGEGLRNLLTDLQQDGCVGVNVTLPHKMRALRCVTRAHPTGATCGAVNTIRFEGEDSHGYNTDIAGVRGAIFDKVGATIGPRDRCVILGTGGAARAVLACMRDIGCEVEVLFREPQSCRTTSLRSDFPDLVARPIGEFPRVLRRATLVVDATSACMEGDGSPVPPDHLWRDFEATAAHLRLVFCVAIRTDAMFLRCARRAGIAQVDGISMMVHQAREAFRLWSGFEVSCQTARHAEQLIRNVL